MSVEDIAAFLSRQLGTRETAQLEAHLAMCRACRREVTAARHLLHTQPRSSRWWLAVPAAAAALLLALLRPWDASSNAADGAMRGGAKVSVAETSAISALAPADGETVRGTGLDFVWHRQDGNPLYRLTLTDLRGHELWTRETADTILALPATISLEPRKRFFWYVDALTSDGRSLTTGARSFVIAP